MPKVQEKKKWTTQEIEYLRIGFKMSVRLKIIANILQRTETSVNKALIRFGIRPVGFKERTSKTKRMPSGPTAEAYKTALVSHCQESGYPTFLPQRRKLDKSVISACHIEEKKKLQIKPCLNYRPLWSKCIVQGSKQYANWVDINQVVRLLKEIGDEIKPISLKHKQPIVINGTPHTVPQMLLRLNRLRALNGLDPVYISEITE